LIAHFVFTLLNNRFELSNTELQKLDVSLLECCFGEHAVHLAHVSTHDSTANTTRISFTSCAAPAVSFFSQASTTKNIDDV
jgi:hypothetical protein